MACLAGRECLTVVLATCLLGALRVTDLAGAAFADVDFLEVDFTAVFLLDVVTRLFGDATRLIFLLNVIDSIILQTRQYFNTTLMLY